MFDEGHCILQWGSTFRPEYGEVGVVRYLLPDTPIYVTSATIPPPMIPDIRDKLHLQKDCLLSRRSNDRPNIHFVVLQMKYPQNSYHDLAFLIPKDWKDGDPLPVKFMVFFNRKKQAEDAALYLMARLPLALRNKLVWFHAGMTNFFRVEKVEEYKKGDLWGMTMTDAGGMVGTDHQKEKQVTY